MKKLLVTIIMVCLLAGAMELVLAQDPTEPVVEMGDTLVIQPTFNDNPLNSINEWILWDHDGDLNNTPNHTVYKLLRNARYAITTTIEINGRLSLVADKPDLENKPPQIGIIEDLNGNAPNTMFQGGPFTFKNIWWSELNYSSMTNNDFMLMGKLTVDNTSNYIDGCYFEHVRAIVLKATSGKNNSFYVTNNFFNDGGRGAPKVWQGHFINGGETIGQDSVIFRNNTFINTPGNFYNNRKNMTNYIEINHNTLINTCANPFFTTQWIEGHVKNNLLWNVYSWGEDEAYRIEQEPDAMPYSIINIDTLAGEWPIADSTWLDRESDRILEIKNNYYGWTDELEEFWASVDSINAPMWMNARTQAMFDDDANYPGLTEDNTFTKADLGVPVFAVELQGTDGMIDFVKNVLWGDNAGFRWYWEPAGAELPNFDIDWPPLEDLRLAGSTFIGDDGLPLGDLNWYKEHAVRWDMSGWGRITDVENNVAAAPEAFELSQNYPNPFNPTTTIHFSLPTAGHVNVTIYNMLGETVNTLVDGYKTAGAYHVQWDGADNMGQAVPSGVYFYSMKNGPHNITKKMMLVK